MGWDLPGNCHTRAVPPLEIQLGRIRTIKPEFPQSESMGRVSRESRLCFILLFTLADDAGRLRGNSRMLASLLYPYDDDAKKHIDGWLSELHREDCITRYEADGDQYIQLNKWLQHQKIDKPSPSKIPPHDNSIQFANPREDSVADQGRDQGKEGIKDAPDGFEVFWEAYPKKVGKPAALKAYKAAKLNGSLEAVLKDVAGKAHSEAWMKQGGQFIPNPSTYLNQRRWEDLEPEVSVTMPSKDEPPAYQVSDEHRAKSTPMPAELRKLTRKAA